MMIYKDYISNLSKLFEGLSKDTVSLEYAQYYVEEIENTIADLLELKDEIINKKFSRRCER